MMAKFDADLKDGGRRIKEFQLQGRMTFILGKLLEAVVQNKLAGTLRETGIYQEKSRLLQKKDYAAQVYQGTLKESCLWMKDSSQMIDFLTFPKGF